jgi:acetyl-CoA decarbonylase/synthase complex subunit beta
MASKVCAPHELRDESPSAIDKFPMEIGEMYEGERIRKPDMYVEFGGVDVPKKFELVLVKSIEEVEDGKVDIIGPDLPQLKIGGAYPLGILIEVAGKKVDKDIEGVLERRVHYFTNYIEGVMHLNQRTDMWIRINKKTYDKGLNSLKWVGKALIMLFNRSLPIIEKIQVTFITDPKNLEDRYQQAVEVYKARDARARGLMEEEVEEFYSCSLCQSFAPTHVCIITPNRMGGCGSISWFDARASANVDPKGPNLRVKKGECLDPVKGIYTGVDEVVRERSLGAIEHISLHTIFGHPHTSCGCFESIAFFIPEVDGIGIVHRDFKGPSVNGLTFSTMAGHTSGGTQNPGFLGIAIEYMRSAKFLQADGGWSRVVWMPSQVKERVKDTIPPDMFDSIATENNVKTIGELREYVKGKNHPIIQRWKEAPKEEATPITEEESVAPEGVEIPAVAGGFQIILKNARIVADKVIIKRAEKK